VEVKTPDRARYLVALIALAAVLAGCGRTASQPAGEGGSAAADASGGEVVLTPESAQAARERLPEETPAARRSQAQVVELQGVGSQGAAPNGDPRADAPSPGAPTDAEVRAELREARAALANFKKHLNTTAFLATGKRARVLPDGTAVAPENAPEIVKRVILAGNEIAKFPYKWGGGHGAWRDNGYDCSGSVSFALAGAGLLKSPLTSGGFLNYGAPGPGRWITIYTNQGHIFMVVAGLRFDTVGQGRAGTRWQEESVSTAGFAVRHIPGL
jgi:cell wall-associated NlpC family hydrolase